MSARSRGFRKELRGGKPHWIIDFRYVDKDGRTRRFRRDASVNTGTAAAAEAQRLKLLAAANGFVRDADQPGEEDAPKRAKTFQEFVESTFAEKFLPTYKPSTRRRYQDLFRQHVIAGVGDLALAELDANRFRDFALKLRAVPVQLKGPLTLVRTVLRAAVSSGELAELPKLPALVKQPKKIPVGPQRGDVEQLMEACPPWLRVALGLGVYGGLRSGEIRALEVRDLHLTERRIHVQRALSDDEVTTTKGDAERWVPIPDPLLPLLVEAKRSKLPNARLVATPKGRTPTRQLLLHCVRRVQAANGLKKWTVHQLRHFYCSELVRLGIGIETVRVLAGHRHLHTTARYLHASTEEMDAAARVLSIGQRVGNGRRAGSEDP